MNKLKAMIIGINGVSRSHYTQWRKWGSPTPTHGFVFQIAKASELPLQLGVVLFGLHFGLRVDVFSKTHEASLAVYLLRWALISSWFKQEA